MTRFLVLYPEPLDPEAFDRHYFEVHLPLAKRLPGLRGYRISRSPSVVRGRESYHLVAELEWDDVDSLRKDFASELGAEVARDADHLAELCPNMRSLVYDLETEEARRTTDGSDCCPERTAAFDADSGRQRDRHQLVQAAEPTATLRI